MEFTRMASFLHTKNERRVEKVSTNVQKKEISKEIRNFANHMNFCGIVIHSQFEKLHLICDALAQPNYEQFFFISLSLFVNLFLLCNNKYDRIK